jgi:hypothetical protein
VLSTIVHDGNAASCEYTTKDDEMFILLLKQVSEVIRLTEYE